VVHESHNEEVVVHLPLPFFFILKIRATKPTAAAAIIVPTIIICMAQTV
jgi:hypothetical protein